MEEVVKAVEQFKNRVDGFALHVAKRLREAVDEFLDQGRADLENGGIQPELATEYIHEHALPRVDEVMCMCGADVLRMYKPVTKGEGHNGS